MTSATDLRGIVERGYDACGADYARARDRLRNERHLEEPFLLDRGFHVTGIDISAQQIRLAERSLPDGEFRRGDLRTVDIPAESFDAVVSFYAIFHTSAERNCWPESLPRTSCPGKRVIGRGT